MNTPRNPFEHHHEHAHHDAVGDNNALDPAQESLADALRVSFFLLKIVMALMVIWYLFSGVFNVSEQQVAVRLRFGHLVGDQISDQVLRPGGPNWTLPYPIDQVLYVPTDIQTIALNDSFWFDDTQANRANSPLNPEKDSYLLSGDANIVHAKWKITYRIGGSTTDSLFDQRVIDYIVNVGSTQHAQRLIRIASEKGIVAFAGEHVADDLIDALSQGEIVQIKKAIQLSLDRLRTGIQVTNVAVDEPQVPQPVRSAFAAVTKANSERRKGIEEAITARDTILNQVAGGAHEPLWQLIRAHEIAYESENKQAIQASQAKLDQAFKLLKVTLGQRTFAISGQVAKLVLEARTFRTQYRNQLASEADQFTRQLASYRASPATVRNLLMQNRLAHIFEARNEIVILPNNANLVYQINADPMLKEKWNKQDMQAEADKQ